MAQVGEPLVRLMRVVLSNGATVRMTTVTRRKDPVFSRLDIYNHGKWVNKVETDETDNAKANWAPDFSKFYEKFKYSAAEQGASAGGEQPAPPAATAPAQVAPGAGNGAAAATGKGGGNKGGAAAPAK